MASINNVARAKAVSLAIGKIVGIEPDLDIQEKKVRLYYGPQKSEAAAAAWANFINSSDESDIQVDIAGQVLPGITQKYWMYGLGALGAIYALSK